MEDVLKNIDSEKRIRIINSTIEEFSLYPFDKASTNNIVKNAGISKGLLFHYFGSKKELYEYTMSFAMNKLFNEISNNINWNEKDIFERIKQIVIMKTELMYQYPNLFNFVLRVFSNNDKAKNMKAIIAIYEKYDINIEEITAKLYTFNIDYTLFSNNFNMEEKINIIRWTMEKYAEEKGLLMLNDLSTFNMEMFGKQIDEYINVLKKTFY